jgi:plastocyanin
VKHLALAFALVACATKPHHVSKTYQVEMHGMQFVPATLNVEVGDLIVWTNHDIVPHSATMQSWFDSGPLTPGQQFSYAIVQPVELDYGCSFHPTMKGKLLAN